MFEFERKSNISLLLCSVLRRDFGSDWEPVVVGSNFGSEVLSIYLSHLNLQFAQLTGGAVRIEVTAKDIVPTRTVDSGTAEYEQLLRRLFISHGRGPARLRAPSALCYCRPLTVFHVEKHDIVKNWTSDLSIEAWIPKIILCGSSVTESIIILTTINK